LLALRTNIPRKLCAPDPLLSIRHSLSDFWCAYTATGSSSSPLRSRIGVLIVSFLVQTCVVVAFPGIFFFLSVPSYQFTYPYVLVLLLSCSSQSRILPLAPTQLGAALFFRNSYKKIFPPPLRKYCDLDHPSPPITPLFFFPFPFPCH